MVINPKLKIIKAIIINIITMDIHKTLSIKNIVSELIVIVVLVLMFSNNGLIDNSSLILFQALVLLLLLILFLKMVSSKSVISYNFNYLLLIVFIFNAYLYFFSKYKWPTLLGISKNLTYFCFFIVLMNLMNNKNLKKRLIYYCIIIADIFCLFFVSKVLGYSGFISFINPDHFACVLNIIIPISFYFFYKSFSKVLILNDKYKSSNEYCKLIFFFSSLLILILALLLTNCLSAIISFLFTIFILLIFIIKKSKRKKINVGVFLVMILFCLFFFSITGIDSKLMSLSSGNIRISIWNDAWKLFKSDIMFGSGFETFSYFFPSYQSEGIFSKVYSFAHNDYLQLLCEIGIVGMLSVIIMFFYMFMKCLKNKKNSMFILTIVFCSFSSVAIHSIFNFNIYIPGIILLLVFLLSWVFPNRNEYQSLNELKLKQKPLFYFSLFSYLTLFFLTLVLNTFTLKDCYGKYLNEKAFSLLEYKNTAETVPLNSEYTFILGKAHHHLALNNKNIEIQKMYLTKAMNCFSKSIALNGNYSKAYECLALTKDNLSRLNKTNLYSEIVCLFEKSMKLEPGNAYRISSYAKWLIQYDYEKSLLLYQQAMEKNPNIIISVIKDLRGYKNFSEIMSTIIPINHNSQALIFKSLNKYYGFNFAFNFIKKYIKSYYENDCLMFWIAEKSVYTYRMPWSFSKYFYEKSISLNPLNFTNRIWYGIHLSEKKYYKEALKQLELAIVLGSNNYNSELINYHINICRIRSSD
jgi:tetratricopeptide (TPR) repeat protein